jgi:hypothetical protein
MAGTAGRRQGVRREVESAYFASLGQSADLPNTGRAAPGNEGACFGREGRVGRDGLVHAGSAAKPMPTRPDVVFSAVIKELFPGLATAYSDVDSALNRGCSGQREGAAGRQAQPYPLPGLLLNAPNVNDRPRIVRQELWNVQESSLPVVGHFANPKPSLVSAASRHRLWAWPKEQVFVYVKRRVGLRLMWGRRSTGHAGKIHRIVEQHLGVESGAPPSAVGVGTTFFTMP